MAGLSGRERRGTKGIDTEKERIICLIHERLWLSARSSRRVPPLMAPSPSLFFPPLLSSLFVLSQTSSNVSGRINFSPSSLSSSSALIPLAAVPHLSPPVYSSLPSINFFLLPHLLSFPIQFFPNLAPSQMHTCVPAHVHFSFFPLLRLFLPPVSVSLRRWQCVTVSSRARPFLALCQAHVLGTR